MTTYPKPRGLYFAGDQLEKVISGGISQAIRVGQPQFAADDVVPLLHVAWDDDTKTLPASREIFQARMSEVLDIEINDEGCYLNGIRIHMGHDLLAKREGWADFRSMAIHLCKFYGKPFKGVVYRWDAAGSSDAGSTHSKQAA